MLIATVIINEIWTITVWTDIQSNSPFVLSFSAKLLRIYCHKTQVVSIPLYPYESSQALSCSDFIEKMIGYCELLKGKELKWSQTSAHHLN